MTEKKSKDLSYCLCLNCANIFRYENASEIICPECEKSIQDFCYDKILMYAKSAVLYGYKYRKKYESQMTEKGSITTRYHLGDPSTILCFCAVAALSGIIGNISYDLVKNIIKKIIKKYKHQEKADSTIALKSIEDLEINIFIQCIENYYFDLKGVDSTISEEIVKERFIHEMSNALGPKSNDISKKDILEIAYKVFEKIKSHEDVPVKEDFNNLWKGLKY